MSMPNVDSGAKDQLADNETPPKPEASPAGDKAPAAKEEELAARLAATEAAYAERLAELEKQNKAALDAAAKATKASEEAQARFQNLLKVLDPNQGGEGDKKEEKTQTKGPAEERIDEIATRVEAVVSQQQKAELKQHKDAALAAAKLPPEMAALVDGSTREEIDSAIKRVSEAYTKVTEKAAEETRVKLQGNAPRPVNASQTSFKGSDGTNMSRQQVMRLSRDQFEALISNRKAALGL